MTWAVFITVHKDVIWATGFFTAEVLTPLGLVTFYVLFFIQIKTRKIVLGGITAHPDGELMAQVARNLTGGDGERENEKYLIHDRNTKYTVQFDEILMSSGIKPIKLPARFPNLNAYAERWVKSVKNEIIDRQVLFGKKALSNSLKEYTAHFHHKRNHQGLDNAIPFPSKTVGKESGKSRKKERLVNS